MINKLSPKLQKAMERGKFVSVPQLLQFLIKEWCIKYFPKQDSAELYKLWKAKKQIGSANDLLDDELIFYVNSFEAGLDNCE